MMKRFVSHILLAALAILLSGCARDEKLEIRIQEGLPVTVDLRFAVEGEEIYNTKAEQSILIENRVRNLYIIQFNSSDQAVAKAQYTVGTNGNVVSYFEKEEESDGASTGIIPNFQAVSGTGCRFMAFANINSTLRSELQNNVNTYGDIQKLIYTMTVAGNIERNFFLMTASHDNIDVDNDPDTPLGINLVLKRVDAKVTFRVTMNIHDAVESPELTDLRFRVHNVPSSSYLISRDKPFGANTGTENTWDGAPDSYAAMGNYANFDSTMANNKGGLFSFYIMENRPVPKKMITTEEQGDYSSLYAMREAWWEEGDNTGQPVLGRKFKYAPDAATLVEITGHLEYTRYNQNSGQNEYVNADVTYLVHLGETGSASDLNDPDRVNNYDVRRNVKYIYNVQILGVNSMVVEVESGNDVRPGNEGDLSISTSREVSFDAHYGRTLFQISNHNLDEASWSAETRISGWGTTSIKDGLISSPYDYKWILFAINSEFGGNNDDAHMVKFPGLVAYDGGTDFFVSDGGSLRPDDELRSEIANDRGNRFEFDGQTYTFKKLVQNGYEGYDDNYYRSQTLSDSACLRDINQLINYLKHHPELFNEQGLVNITAFCDEYTYIFDPRRDNYVYQGTPVSQITSDYSDRQRRLRLWKEYANSDRRILNIQPMTSTSVSPDGNTTYTNSYISFSQKPIYTVYNTDVANNAWGLETTNETGHLTYEASGVKGTLPNTTGNGRQNFLNFFIDGNNQSDTRFDWTAIQNTATDADDKEGLNSGYRNVIYACITRNRDLNGNNHIDPDELLWYLASIDQLTILFVAQDALNQEQWLYQGDGSTRNHVISSSYRNTSIFDDKLMWLLWSEEGASRGDVNGSLTDATPYPSDDYDYRCVRNLGIDIAHIEEEPQHYATYHHSEDNSHGIIYTIDLSRLNPMAYRNAFDDGDILPLTNERSETDRPFHTFQIKDELEDDESMSWLEMRDALNNNQNPCPEGWRVPNLRELLVMLSTVNGEHEASDGQAYSLAWPNYVNIATSFSFNGVSPHYTKGDRYGFRYDPPNVRLLNQEAAEDTYIPGHYEDVWVETWYGGYWDTQWVEPSGHAVYFRCVRDHTGN